jgi:transcriptional regulator NrdR family protein
MFVMKRDGAKVPFEKDKIINAINGAFIEVDGQLYETDTAKDIADDIEVYINQYYSK